MERLGAWDSSHGLLDCHPSLCHGGKRGHAGYGAKNTPTQIESMDGGFKLV
jgi:hypothetical protein